VSVSGRVRQRAGWKVERGLARAAGTVFHLDRSRYEVALTFDDGPDPVQTPLLLDRLKAASLPATFFWIGKRAEAHPEIASAVVEAGHAVGSHSYSHPAPAGRSIGELRRDYARGRALAESITGRPVRLFRPPYGTVGVRVAVAMRQEGLIPCLWSLDTRDWQAGVRTADLLERLRAVRPGDVVLFHAGPDVTGTASTDRSATIEVIEPLAQLLSERNLEPVRLAEDGSRPGGSVRP
jgi:peptidoglycan/xylan/chitin deacetylase (PgdA/CDA1 family)